MKDRSLVGGQTVEVNGLYGETISCCLSVV